MGIKGSVITAALAFGLAGRGWAAPEFHGAGWVQFGRIESSYATPGSANNYDENWLGNYGGILKSKLTVDEHWEAGLGIGSLLVHLPRGSTAEADIWYPFWVGFLDEARLTFSDTWGESLGFRLTLGTEPYNYNRDGKNLGGYLLKGYVYPGAIVSGYVDHFAVPSSRSGILARLRLGGLTNDLMVNIETEDKPLYDLSIADVAEWRVGGGLEIGGGFNLYRLLPANPDATSPGRDCAADRTLGPYAGSGPGGGQDNPCFIVMKDSAGVPTDTITGSLAGVKLMARFRLDPKAWFGGPGSLGADDLVLYGEAAVIGVEDYPIVYDNILRRIPVMVGLNFPTFKLFNLSGEVEYYASKNSSDNLPAQHGSWLPAGTAIPGRGRDDWKWSVNASKVVGNVFLGLQVANDHLRLGGTHNTATGQEAMRTPKDWYWIFKTAYFF